MKCGIPLAQKLRAQQPVKVIAPLLTEAAKLFCFLVQSADAMTVKPLRLRNLSRKVFKLFGSIWREEYWRRRSASMEFGWKVCANV
jgi:hypothetical protein